MSSREKLYKLQFETLFRLYFNPLFNFINAQLNDREESREIVQASFLKIWNSRGKINFDSPIMKSYLFTTAKNTLIDHVRKRKKLRKVDTEIEELETKISTTDEKRINNEIIRNEILKAMKNLKPRAEEIFKLNKLEGYTYQEIADHLGISKRAVEDNIRRALIRLKEILKNNDKLYIY